jgi:hypothetical protein
VDHNLGRLALAHLARGDREPRVPVRHQSRAGRLGLRRRLRPANTATSTTP